MQPQQVSPVMWKTAARLVRGGGRIVDIQVTIPTATGGIIQLNFPPLAAEDAKKFAADINQQATGLILP